MNAAYVADLVYVRNSKNSECPSPTLPTSFLRDPFVKTLNDPEVLADTKKLGWTWNQRPGKSLNHW
jgi:hypothetical protein